MFVCTTTTATSANKLALLIAITVKIFMITDDDHEDGNDYCSTTTIISS